MNDKEKIEEAVSEINVLIKFYGEWVKEGYTVSPNRLESILQHLKEIKKDLEK